jgi:type VI secretion system secreted protein VgrG
MEFLTDRKYTFVSKALPPETFAVVDLKGEEGLGRCYRFEILLVSDNAEIDLESVLRSRATLTIHRPETDEVVFHGVAERFEQLQAAGSAVFYRIGVVPRLQRLELTRHNQVFLDQSVQEIIEAVLKEGGLTSQDFEFRLQGEYEKHAYVCQYGESHLNFISRWLEREGIYYYFEQTDSGEKIIFTDTAIAHQPRFHGQELAYAPPSGLLDAEHAEVIQGFVCRTQTVPRTVRLKDYNYRKPSLEITAEAVADEKSSGEVYLYGEHFRTPQEGHRLAGIRAQELMCGKERFSGESTVPFVSPGYTFTLEHHYRGSFNQKYLTVAVTHEGSQAGFLTAGFQQALPEREKRTFYRNQFSAIPARVQFRPARSAHQPRIRGTLNAKIDAAGSGKYAELDEHGRYKVILPFDRSGRREGKASTWLRMAQPYAGADHGMHFPLHKGTEVLLTFIEGHPDRPVIAAAVPNTETPSPVTAADQTMAKITTAGGNKIHIEDQEGNQRILMQTPTAGTWVRVGAPNDPDSTESEPVSESGSGSESESGSGSESEAITSENFEEHYKEASEAHEGYAISTSGWYLAKIGQGKIEFVGPLEQKINFGNVFETVLGFEEKVVVGAKLEGVLGGIIEGHAPSKWEVSPTHSELKAIKNEIAEEKNAMHDSFNRLVVDHTHLAVATSNLADQTTQLSQETFNLGEQVWQVSFQTNSLAEQSSRLAGQVSELKGEETSVIGERMHAIGEQLDTVGERTELIEESCRTIGEETRVIGEATDINGENTTISGLTLLM